MDALDLSSQRRPARRGLVLASGLAGVAMALLGCRVEESPAPEDDQQSAEEAPAVVHFVEVAGELGVEFVHHTGSEGSYPMPAIMGGGAALLDVEGDGDLDLYLVNGGDRFPGGGSSGNRLFVQGEDGRFADATDSSRTGDLGYGMGAAAGDLDNDGDVDLVVTNYGADVLYRNRGDGSFGASARSGFADPGWSTSAAMCDYDRDGLLDVFVTRYVRFDEDRSCAFEGGRADYCGPAQFPGWSDLLYHNLGDGRFEEVSQTAGIAALADRGLGVVCADFDDDGWVDFYVANDSDPNHLWINRGDGTFSEEGMLLGAAFNQYGVGEAGMGVVTADGDGDGDLDLFVTHLIEETNTFYENRGAEGFEDQTATRGLGLPSLRYTGFGTAFFDLELDGDLDLAVVNGAVKRRPQALGKRPEWFWNDYSEPNSLFIGRGDGGFVDGSAQAGPYGAAVEISRGLLPADLDRDGDLDLVVTNVEGPVRIYRNDGPAVGAWLQLRLFDPQLQRAAVGSKATVFAGRQRWTAHSLASGGYLTSVPPHLHFGLGDVDRVDHFEVRWPDGEIEGFAGAPTRQVIVLVRGEGEPP